WNKPIFASDVVTERKSAFLAHAAQVDSSADIQALVDHLRTSTTSRRLKKATHCMWAWRTDTDAGQNDGGESGAGERLARLLELSNCRNAAVVVWRWYGGVPLGSARWKCISGTAKEALRRGGFMR
ncbi:ribosomal protein S5 domain 2-like protein, partial [Punctularia strigosozonata HHB-11173 SS5]|uniref:ribosomal protein S5 domain 2-like protein n=1 Tax=Punctularia strigosozonata (strain HHB-11173) TaxID=741275 RepID=UPI000441714E